MATPAEIEALLRQPEGVELEFKPSRVPPRALSRVIAAFANTRGGTVVVGIDQRKPIEHGALVGVEPDQFLRIVEHSRRHLSPQPAFDAYCVPVMEKQLGVIQVEASRVPIFHDGQFAVRAGTGITTAPFSGIVVGAPEPIASPQPLLDVSELPSRQSPSSRRRRVLLIVMTALVASAALWLINIWQGKDAAAAIPAALIVGGSFLFSGLLIEISTRKNTTEDVSRTRERVRQAEAELEQGLRSRHADLMEAEDDEQARLTLSDLWTVTHRRLDHYHGIALEQAAKSFRNAQAAMTIGFLLLIGFAMVGLFADSTKGAIVASALGTVSAALAGYVSRTFVKSQETAAGHLRAYFDQPLEFSRYLAAERLIADARLGPDQRALILGALVQTMIGGPASSGGVEEPPQAAGDA